MEFADPGHFKTSDKQLALALATAGCKFAPQSEGGPAINRYTGDVLRKYRRLPESKVGPIALEKAAKEAYESRVPGLVTYLFENDDTLKRAIKAWDAMVREMEDAEKEERPPELPQIPEETVMQLAYIRRLNEKEFAKAPFFNVPLVSIGDMETHEVKTKGPEPRQVTTGKFKCWQLGASDETRKAIKLQTA